MRPILEHLRNWGAVLSIIVPIFFIVLIAGIFWLSQQRKDHAIASLKWPTTTAIIVEAEVNELPKREGTRMVVNLIVEYTAEGKLYRNQVTKLFPRTTSKDYKSLLREGAQIPLRYDPQNSSSFSMSPLVPD
jgi:hypothetical protein